jgi:NADP-dependent 3-hydroxy acid dehydrogenase YdfG
MLITGASSGIGAALARAAAADYKLVLVARGADKLEALAAELPDAVAAPCDVCDWPALRAVAERAGAIDVVVANAGIGAARGLRNDDPERWAEMVQTNVLGVALTIRATLDAVIAARGHLVLTGAVAGRRILPGSVFSATKAAVAALAEAAREEVAGTGARVTLVAPGTVDTPFYDNPQGDALRAPDVAEAILWAVGQPARVDVSEVLVRPVAQRYP